MGDSIVSSLSNYNTKDGHLRNKIVFYMENLPRDMIIQTPIDSTA